jgi:hypothetical protein
VREVVFSAFRRFRGRTADLKLGSEIQGAWADALGPQLASNLTPVNVRGGELVVGALSSVWLVEARFLAQKIKDRLNARLGREKVRKVTIKLLKEAPVAVRALEEAARPSAEEVLEPERMRALDEALDVLPDDALRQTLRRIFIKAVRARGS